MKRRSKRGRFATPLAGGVALLASACTPAAAPSVSVQAPSAAVVPAAAVLSVSAPSASSAEGTTPRMRLGHYSTSDGLFGLVLDRTPRLPRVMIDGTSKVLELGVRNIGDGVVTLESARAEIVLAIDGDGHVSVITDPRREVGLRRDANAQPLPEPPLPTVDAAWLATLDARAKQKCTSAVHFEIAGNPPASSARGSYPALERATRAVEIVCRDRTGQDAVKRKLRVVRLVQGSATRLSLDAGILSIETDLEGQALGPFSDEIRGFVESKL